jgi:hypothetical protein
MEPGAPENHSSCSIDPLHNNSTLQATRYVNSINMFRWKRGKKWFAIALCLGNMLYFKRTRFLSAPIDLWFSQSNCSVIDSITETVWSPVAVIKHTHFAENMNVVVICEEYHEKYVFLHHSNLEQHYSKKIWPYIILHYVFIYTSATRGKMTTGHSFWVYFSL